jgi:dUTP pyrophosphatase
MEVKIINRSKFSIPKYATEQSAGLDIKANTDEPITIAPLERVLIPTGLYIQLPTDHEAQIRPRSGLAIKHGIGLLNSPGTIDADYRGEIKIIVVNLSNESYTLNPGERIAQMVIGQYKKITFKEVEILEESDRGQGGFGSTGKI